MSLRQDTVAMDLRETPDRRAISLPGEFTAARTTTPAQRFVLLSVAVGLFAAVIAHPVRVLNGLNEAMMAFYALVLIHRAAVLIAGAVGARADREIRQSLEKATPGPSPSAETISAIHPAIQPAQARIETSPESLPDREYIPTISILIPLFREVEVVPQIVDAMGRMDYPVSRLEVLLLLEEDDKETRAACSAAVLPSHFRTVVVPPGKPRTKPRACNYGLEECRGELVVVYDAEDQPETDQLLRAARALQAAPPSVACVQARLAYYNPRQNLLTRWFAAEYMGWFELMLPGLHRIGAPIPLGGTSNHFRTAALRFAGGWDSWNVAEDCDLGIRLFRQGYRVRLLDSTTWEEACPDLKLWVRQRSRWVKGYLQTWLVHTRHPLALWREMGPWGFVNMQLLVGGSVLCLLLNPIYWLLTVLWWTYPTRWESALMVGPTLVLGNLSFTVGNTLFVALQSAGAVRRKQWDLALPGLLAPVYWLLMSVAAWKALLQIITAPHHWEKTLHGLARMPPADALPAPAEGNPAGQAES